MPLGTAHLQVGFGQGGQQDGTGDCLEGLGERLNEADVAVEGTGGVGLAGLQLAHKGQQLIYQDDAGRGLIQQSAYHFLAR